MANEKEDILQANVGAPTAEIPDLKKKDKERKKAGAAWRGAGGASGDFSGATGGAGAARAAASAAAAAETGLAGVEAAESGGIWAAISRFIAGLTSTMLGKLAATAAAFLLVGGAGLLGYKMMKGGGDAPVGAPDMGAISDSMKVRSGGSDRMGVASKGEVRFDPLAAAKPAPTPPPAASKPEEKPAPDVKPDADAAKPMPAEQLAHNLSGAKLSNSLGGDFGNKNIFAGGNSNAPKFDAGAASMKKFPSQNGKLGQMQASTIHATPASRGAGKAGSKNNAFAQLKLTKGLSMQSAHAVSAEGAAVGAQGAFDQSQSGDGALGTAGAPGGDTVSPPSSAGGAPDTSAPGVSDPAGAPGVDTGLQNSLAQIQQMANQATSDIQQGMELIIVGTALIVAGVALLAIWGMEGVGIAMIAAGVLAIIMGIMQIMQGKNLAQQAMAQGQQLASSIDNLQQGEAVNYCTQQAVAGTSASSAGNVANCTPPESITNSQNEAEGTQYDNSGISRLQQWGNSQPTLGN